MALAALYDATNGDEWKDNRGWFLAEGPLGDWHGVDTDAAGRVARLDLGDNGLVGPIPVEIGDLSSLAVLNLRDNELTGSLPRELGNLRRLDTLNLMRNQLEGVVPGTALGRLVDLRFLRLGYNRFRGAMPVEIGSLAKLEYLDLKRNKMEGPIPPELGALSELRVLDLAAGGFSGPIPPELGDLANLHVLRLRHSAFEGPIPPELGALSELRFLDLAAGGFSGSIPPELGNLASLRVLRLQHNAFEGPIPPELGALSELFGLRINDTELTGAMPTTMLRLAKLRHVHLPESSGFCVPGTARFLRWLDRMEQWSGQVCGAEDVGVLARVFEDAEGPLWTSARGWLDAELPIDRHGVTTDTTGRVVAIDLEGNGLVGTLPAELGRLAALRVLRVGGNSLWGEIPASLADAPLRQLSYFDTDLCLGSGLSEEQLQALVLHDGRTRSCDEIDYDRHALSSLYTRTRGSRWLWRRNWLSHRPVGEWAGVETNADGRVVGLRLRGIGLTGTIPPQLAHLDELRILDMRSNQLSGPLPPELGRLQALEVLALGSNTSSGRRRQDGGGAGIAGPLPKELGDLANLRELRLEFNKIDSHLPRTLGALRRLEVLDLFENDLWGRIPSELGQATSLREVRLSNNDLSGDLPETLGDLAELELLDLSENQIAGPLPPKLGQLRRLMQLRLGGNLLSGPLPPEFQELAELEHLSLARNSNMAGPLPAELADGMTALEELLLGGTDLCAQRLPPVTKWLGRIPLAYVELCEPEQDRASSVARAYLTQAVQSASQPVPLIAGRKALLRVFLGFGDKTPSTDGQRSDDQHPPDWPDVHATFFVDGAEVHATGPFSAAAVKVPKQIDEHDARLSANIEIPGSAIRPGLAMALEIDFAGADDSWLCCGRPIDNHAKPVDVRVAPPLHLVAVPLLSYANPDSSILDAIRNLDPEHDLLADLLSLTPVGELRLEVREPAWTASSEPIQALREIEAMRVVEGHDALTYFMGLKSDIPPSVGGLAHASGSSTISLPDARLIAHEIMHNFSAAHAPCFKRGIDAGYPHPRGRIGSVGYDFRTGTVVPAATFDLMGNLATCLPSWISDYHFNKALQHRLTTDPTTPNHAAGLRRPNSTSTTSLLVWGGTTSDGKPFLEPAFVVNAPVRTPPNHGAYQVVGTAPNGQILFSRRFDMQQVADGDGNTASFAFVVPAQPEWAGKLASLTLVGPQGQATIGQDHNHPTAALLQDRRSGHVKGILRNWTQQPRLALELAPRLSAGVPSPAAWQR